MMPAPTLASIIGLSGRSYLALYLTLCHNVSLVSDSRRDQRSMAPDELLFLATIDLLDYYHIIRQGR